MGPFTAKGQRLYAAIVTVAGAGFWYYIDGNWDRFIGAACASLAIWVLLGYMDRSE